MAKVIVTGSTGFIGKRLVYQLLEKGHEVYALSRFKGIELKISDHHAHIIYGDIRDPTKAINYPLDADVAYYLIHSMGNVVQNLLEEEEACARNFIAAMEKIACKQI